MARLPDVPVDLWRQFQATIFGEKADSLESAESFRWSAGDAIANLPADDGTDWQAEVTRLEEEQRRRQEEQRRQIEAQARLDQEDYQRIADERAVAARANEFARNAPPGTSTYNDPTAGGTQTQPLSFADQANGMISQAFGPEPAPMPEDASASERYAYAGADQPPGPLPPPMRNAVGFDPATGETFATDATPAELMSDRQSPSFADTANSLMQQTFGPESSIGSALSAVNTGLTNVTNAVLPSREYRQDVNRRMQESARGLPLPTPEQAGAPIDVALGNPPGMAVQAAQDVSGVLGPDAGPALAAAAGLERRVAPVVEAAGRGVRALGEEGARQLMDLTPISRMVPPGEGGGLQASAAAIRTLREAGTSEDVLLAAERSLAEGADVPLSAVQKLTREAPLAAEIPNPTPLTAEERALNNAADIRAREAPPHAGYLEDPTFEVDVPQPGDRIRLPDGTRARVEESPASTVAEPPQRPSVPFAASKQGLNTLYHETDPTTALLWPQAISSEALRGLQVSPEPTLALGQAGRGALVELVGTDQLAVRPLTGKPGAGLMEAAGQQLPEWQISGARGRPAEHIQSITLKPDAQLEPLARNTVTRLTERQGWTREVLPDGSVKLTNPDVGAVRAPEAPVAPAPGDRIRLPDGTRATVDAPPLAETVYEPPRPAPLAETVYEPPRATAGGGGRMPPPPPAPPPAPPGAPLPLPPPGGRPGRLPTGARAITLTPEEEVARLRLDKFPEELRPHLQQAASDLGFAHAQRRGVFGDEAVRQAADAIGTTVDQWIKRGRAGRAYNAEEVRAVRNLMAGQARKIDRLSRDIAEAQAAGTVTDAMIIQAHQEAEKLAGLVTVVEGARAEQGRGLRAWRSVGTPTDPSDAARRIFSKFGGGPEGRQRALDALTEFNAIPPDDTIARAKFWAAIESGGRITSTDWLVAARYASMLSQPSTWEIAWIGSMFQAVPKIASDVLAAASRPGSGELGEAAKGTLLGIQRGVRPFWETIRHGITSEQAVGGALPKGLGPRAVGPGEKVVAQALDIPGRLVAAPDALFTSIFSQAELGRQAAIAAYKRRLTGTTRDEFIANFLVSPPPSEAAAAKRIVDGLMLRGDLGPIGKSLEDISGKSHPLIRSIIMPFYRVASHIWTQGLEMSPVGTAMTAFDVARAPFRNGPYAKGFGEGAAAQYARPLPERLRHNAIGLGITGGAVSLAVNGGLSGLGPDDPEKRAELQAQGWQPYSIKIGDRWVSYANWGAASVPFSMAAAYVENQRYRKPGAKPDADMLDMVRRVASLTTEMTFLQSVGDAFKAIDEPDRYGPAFIASLVNSSIPFGGALSTAASFRDETQRRPERVSQVGVVENIKQSVEARLPGLREQVPEALDPLGRPLPNLRSGAMALQPFRISPERQDPILQAYLDAGIDIGAPPSEITLDGAKISLTTAQQHAYQREMGAMLADRFDLAEGYEGGMRTRKLQQILDRARTMAKARVLADMDPDEVMSLKDAAREQRLVAR